jgi:hypothetical protein
MTSIVNHESSVVADYSLGPHFPMPPDKEAPRFLSGDRRLDVDTAK